MARYIDAEEIRIELERLTLINNLTQRQDDVTEEYKSVHKGMTSAYNHCRNIILDAPTADVVEVKHGKWVAYPHNSGIYCSECRHKRRYKDMNDKFCPNCGAKMAGERKD